MKGTREVKQKVEYNLENKVLAFAAEELKRYINKIFLYREIEFCYSLSVDDTHQEENDTFSINTGISGGEICGNSERAVLLGVYHYLYLLGCRFLGPNSEVVPVILGELPIIYERKTASLYHRGVCIEGSSSRENVLAFIDWLPKVGYNSFFLQFTVPYTFLARWYHHENNPYVKPEIYTMDDAIKDMKLFETEIAKRGLLLHKVGHGWTGAALGYETVSWDGTTAPLTEEERQLLALQNGKRDWYEGCPANTNLCYSKEQTIDAFVEKVTEYAKMNPQVQYLHVWLADACNNICECEECKKTTPTDQYVNLLNEIDRRFTQENLETKIVFLLYQELLWPPIKEKLKNDERFVLMFAPITRTFEKSYLVDERLPEIPEYKRNQITLPTNLEENQAFLCAWQQQFEGDSFVFDYPLGRAHYGDFGYVHISSIISQDIKKLRQLGLNGYISCQELRVMHPNGLPNYVMGRTLFDETLSFDTLVEEYYSAAYGDDWYMVREYLEGISNLCSCDYVNAKGPRRNPLIADNMKKIHEWCKLWESKIQGRNGRHWEVLIHHNKYIQLLSRAIELFAGGKEDEASLIWGEMRKYVCLEEHKFQAELDVYRMINITRDYTGIRQPNIESFLQSEEVML